MDGMEDREESDEDSMEGDEDIKTSIGYDD